MSKQIHISYKKFVALIVCIVVFTASFGVYLSRAITTSPTAITISSGPYPGASTYTIWQEGSINYAKNVYGETVESTANASQVFIEVIANMTLGGNLYVKNALYTFDTEVKIDPLPNQNWEINIIGESREKTIIAGSNSTGLTDGALINCTFTSWTVGGLYYRRNINIMNIRFQVFGVEAYALKLPFVCTILRNVYVSGEVASSTSAPETIYVKIGGPAAPAYPSIIDGLEIDSYSTMTNTSHLLLYTWLEGLQINQLTLQSYANATYLWRMWGLSTHVSKLNVFIQASSHVTSGVVYALGTTFEQYTFDSICIATPSAGSTPQLGSNYFIKVASDFTGNVTVSNLLFNHTDFAAICKDAKTSASVQFHGIGFENAGNQASCINGTAIAHGLLSTPTSITLSIFGTNPVINSTAYYFGPTVLTANATHFIVSFCINNAGTLSGVTVVDAKTIYWDAVYKP